MKPTPDLYDRLRADAARAAQQAPRRGRNPYEPEPLRSARTYRDPTGDQAAARVDASRKKDPRR